MNNDTVGTSAVGPFILRIALAVIFIFNGAMKINEKTDWGATWADKLWQKSGGLPDRVAAKIDDLPNESEARKSALKEKLEAMYQNEAGYLPDTLSFPAIQLAVAWGEVVGGVALLLGLLTRFWALAMIVVQVGAIWTVTLGKGFSIMNGGYEYNFALVAMCLALVVAGAGTWSLDRWLSGKPKATADRSSRGLTTNRSGNQVERYVPISGR